MILEEEKTCTLVMLYPIVIGPQFQNFTLKVGFLTWPQKFFTVTLKWFQKIKTFLQPASGGNVFIDIFEKRKI